MCPLCLSLIASSENELVSHLLAGHPREAASLGLAVTLANVAFARQPAKLLLVDLAVLALAVILVRKYRLGWS